MVLSAEAHLRAVGQPDDLDLSGLSDFDIRSLAGEAYAAPACGLALAAFFANPYAPWWEGMLPGAV